MSSPADASLAAGSCQPPGDPEAALAALAGCADPHLIGVRHHSPALAAMVPQMLAAFRPEAILLELPPEFARWLPWLADERTVAPVALAGAVRAGGRSSATDDPGPRDLAFYPFADFSPELVAVRWAAREGVPVIPCDLSLADPSWRRRPGGTATGERDGRPSALDALRASATGRVDDDVWDRVVEARAPGGTAEALRRAALLVGWAARNAEAGAGGPSPLDLRREAAMRGNLAWLRSRGQRVVAMVGAYHAAALADRDAVGAEVPDPLRPEGSSAAGDPEGLVTSMVSYSFALLDARSGYPAGIRDPRWQQSVLLARCDPEAVDAAAAEAAVAVCAAVRRAGHPSGPAEAREVVRMAGDLARLRGLPACGRGEIVEAIQSVLAQGEVLGRGRAVASAMEEVLVGRARGVLAPATPISGLGPSVRELLADLRLPYGQPAGQPRRLRLDPLRSDLDRRREIALNRMAVCSIPYATGVPGEGVGGEQALTTLWQVEWTPATETMLDVAGLHGVTLGQAAEGVLRGRWERRCADGALTAGDIVTTLGHAASCGFLNLTDRVLGTIASGVPAGATLPELIDLLSLVDRLLHGGVPGAPTSRVSELSHLPAVAPVLEMAAHHQLSGLIGSADREDAVALAALARRSENQGTSLGLASGLARLRTEGTPMMGAAAGAIEVLLGTCQPEQWGISVASWIDLATTGNGRQDLEQRLTGLLVVAQDLLACATPVLDGLLDRVAALPDDEFVRCLPALRAGFHTLSPAARDRLLAVIADRHQGSAEVFGDVDAMVDRSWLAARLVADAAGARAVRAWGLMPPEPEPEPGARQPGVPGRGNGPAPDPGGPRAIGPIDRWRLILGRESCQLPAPALRYATALDELYGSGQGEGSVEDAEARAGRAGSFPGVRQWSEELTTLFGQRVREEVMVRAVAANRLDAAELLDPESVRPSVELLRTVLSLAGGMPERAVARLRPLVARMVEELTRQLATQVRPALTGLTTSRPTRRPTGQLDLARTLRANLATSRREPDGQITVIPERPVFRANALRGMDWRLILVVDVSGSMEASVIWSAVTASILAGIPALTTGFVAFSTEVVDLSDRVDDPLGLLLEVRVGGGTHIAAGLRYARSLVRVPSRTMIVVVSDFEEGYPVAGLLAEARALVQSGCRLLGCASLDDAGRPRYCVSTAGQLAGVMPVAALSPLELARWVAERVRT